MYQPDRKAKPHFSHPVRQIVLMLVALGLTGFGAFVALPRVMPIFEANPYLNGAILVVFVIGVLACFLQVAQLITSVRWIERFASDAEGDHTHRAPQLLAPLATLLRSRGARMQIAATSTRSILDSVATRIDEAREITRYIVNLLIFLGLLGTFYGLATTVPAVVDTIRSLAPKEGDAGVDVFNRLMTGLEAQLGGMGVAFASSLLGLAGSLVVGLLELFASHGQNRFYRELEEWLSTITRLGISSGDGEQGGDGVAFASVIEHLAEQMSALQLMYADSDVGRAIVEEKLGTLADSMTRMADRMGGDGTPTEVLTRVAEGQERLIATLQERGGDGGGDGIDAESRMRLRSIDVQLLRILEEISSGRQESTQELRADIKALGRVVAARREGAASLRPTRVVPGDPGAAER